MFPETITPRDTAHSRPGPCGYVTPIALAGNPMHRHRAPWGFGQAESLLTTNLPIELRPGCNLRAYPFPYPCDR